MPLTITTDAYVGGGQPDYLGKSATDEISVWGATPAAQTTPSGDTTTPTAGSTTSVYVNTTFSGGSGTTAYTVGDIVAALKSLGVLQA